MKAYTPAAYQFVSETSGPSARRIVPLVAGWLRPRSVVDLGCGTGDWLAAFRQAGAERVLGLDGPWVPRAQLRIEQDEFRPADLRDPVQLDQSFDLALCLEVMGYLPRPFDDVLLESLTRAAPAVLFSAPIPLQGSIGGNATNREWPAHWAARLRDRGFVALDCIRETIWDDPQVAWWFAQNLFLAVHCETLPRFPALTAAATHSGLPRALVHPRCFESTLAAARVDARPLRELLPALGRAVIRKGQSLLRPRTDGWTG